MQGELWFQAMAWGEDLASYLNESGAPLDLLAPISNINQRARVLEFERFLSRTFFEGEEVDLRPRWMRGCAAATRGRQS
jgi:hypothetical protein